MAKSTASWVVHKFGGTSVGSAARFQKVVEILRSETSPRKAIVVSAMSGVTNALIDLVDKAMKQDDSYLGATDALKKRHEETVRELLTDSQSAEFLAALESDFRDLKEVLRGIWLAKGCSELTTELVAGFGELWSARLLTAYLNAQGIESRFLDARKVLFVEPAPLAVAVQWEVSRPKVATWLEQNPSDTIVITGYVASTLDGKATTLKRNGSDFSASIFGALLRASAITIWTDVDGVLSADPRLVPEAVCLDELSYNEATELAYFGAKVVHPSTMGPAIQDHIPIWIRNTFKPTAPGTKIHASARSISAVKGFATINDMALINLEGTGMIGVPGVAQRLFGGLRDVGVSVVMISQGSSEHSICFAIPQAQSALAKETVEKTFWGEIQQGQIQSVVVTPGCSILAVVGDGMVRHPGVAGRFFAALGKSRVNIRAIAQGSSERNISAVVDGHDATRALRAVHSGFYLSHQTISIGLVGAGLIGGTFLDQVQAQLEELRSKLKIDLRVRGILTTSKMLLGDPEIDLKSWRSRLKETGTAPDLAAFVAHINSDYLPHSAIIDATANGDLPRLYPEWLQKGIHIITPNKKGNTASMQAYRHVRETAQKSGRHYLYSTTVGAGLPVLNTLKDLIKTGDKVIQVEGILSGTLSFIFNSFTESKKFSEVVKEARKLGYTEPDPRDDLSGMDVARKLVILAREMGLELELTQINVENLVPEELRLGSVDACLDLLPKYDAKMESRRLEAQKKDQLLRYVGVVDKDGKASVTLRAYPRSHPFANLNGTDNIIAFKTERYFDQPIFIRGPGAGPQVTAAGVFADLLRLISFLGVNA